MDSDTVARVASRCAMRVDVFSDVLSDVRVVRVREAERQRARQSASRRDAAEVSGYAVGAIFFQYQLREKSVAYGDGAEHLAGTAFRTANGGAARRSCRPAVSDRAR